MWTIDVTKAGAAVVSVAVPPQATGGQTYVAISVHRRGGQIPLRWPVALTSLVGQVAADGASYRLSCLPPRSGTIAPTHGRYPSSSRVSRTDTQTHGHYS